MQDCAIFTANAGKTGNSVRNYGNLSNTWQQMGLIWGFATIFEHEYPNYRKQILLSTEIFPASTDIYGKLRVADDLVPANGINRIYKNADKRHIAQIELPKTASRGCPHLAMPALVA